MAERILQEFLPDHNISSAGVMTVDGLKASGNAVLAMKEKGHDLTDHRSRKVTQEMLDDVDLVLTMTSTHKEYLLPLNENTFTLGEYSETNEEVSDPYGRSLDEYRECRDQLYRLLKVVAGKINNENK